MQDKRAQKNLRSKSKKLLFRRIVRSGGDPPELPGGGGQGQGDAAPAPQLPLADPHPGRQD